MAGNVTQVGDMRNMYEVLVGKPGTRKTEAQITE
jgi:hypothetical protein